MNRRSTGLFAPAVLVLLFGARAGAEDETRLRAEVQKDFRQFAAAVKDDNYDEAARRVAPPADAVWARFAAFRSASVRYRQALEEKFGAAAELSLLLRMYDRKGDLAEHFYETAGDIREVKPAGDGRAVVRVWSRRPDWRNRSETALYERTFTAVKVGGRWKFQLHTFFGGTPVLKKVKRKTADGEEVEVYAEHFPKTPDERTWEELKPISHDGREEDLRQEAVVWSRFTEALQAQTEQVRKGTYKSRKDALEATDQAMKKVFDDMRKERSRR